MKWPNLTVMSECCQIPDRASAAVADAALKGAGLITDLDKTYTIHKKSCEEKEKSTYPSLVKKNQHFTSSLTVSALMEEKTLP